MRLPRLIPLLFVCASGALAADQPLATLTGAASTPVVVTRLSGGEAVSALYRFEVDLAGPPVSFDSLLGREVTVTLRLPGGKSRHFSGIVSRFSAGSRQRVEIVPKLWLLTRRVQSRAFQSLSVPEILSQVLGEAGIARRMELHGSYPQRDCTVQYGESDFSFASRLMEEEGIFYFFTHSASGHEMVLGDTPQSHPDLPGGATLRWLGTKRGEGVHEWEKVQEIRPGKVTLRDFAFQFPDDPFEVSTQIQESVAAGRVTHRLRVPGSERLEVFDYPGGYAQRFDGIDGAGRDDIQTEADRLVEIRAEEEAAHALRVEAAANLGQLTAGHRFTLGGHFDADGRYLITGVQHSATETSAKRQIDYDNRFTCIPDALPFRPARTTPRPVIAGVQSAVVIGPPGATVHTDGLGRVKVQFPWDRESRRDESSSCWVRVASLHAGQEDGWSAVPEVGEEVMVAFEHGDPDRPVIVGSVFNPGHPPPAPRP